MAAPAEQQVSMRALLNTLPARKLDLLHDMGDAERFAIDGDSLILEALLDERVLGSCSQNLAPLALDYVIETLLNNLVEASGSFDILFFDIHRAVWDAGAAAVGAMRRLLIRHLENLPQQRVLHFNSFLDERWAAYLQRQKPAFLLITEPSAWRGIARLTDSLGAGPARCLAELIAGCTLSALMSGTDCAYLPQLEFDSRTAHAFCTAAVYCSQLLSPLQEWLLAQMQAAIAAAAASGAVAAAAAPEPAAQQQLRRLLSELLTAHGTRVGLGILCCYGHAYQETTQLVDGLVPHSADTAIASKRTLQELYLLHVVLLQHLSLQQRAIKLPPHDSKAQSSTLQQLQQQYMDLMLQRLSSLMDMLPSRSRCAANAHPADHNQGDAATPIDEPQLLDACSGQLFAALVWCYERVEYDGVLPSTLPQALLGLTSDVYEQWQAAVQLLQALQQNGSTNGRVDGPRRQAAAAQPATAAAPQLQPATADAAATHGADNLPPAANGCPARHVSNGALVITAPPGAVTPTDRTGRRSQGRTAITPAAVAVALPPEDGGGRSLSFPAAVYAASADLQWQQLQLEVAQLPGAKHTFGGSSTFEERYHWHVKKELEAAFWSEARDNKDLDLSWLLRGRAGRSLTWEEKARLSDLLAQANEASSRADKSELMRQAALVADQAIKKFRSRQAQMQSAALLRMVKSLENATFYLQQRVFAPGKDTKAQAKVSRESAGALAIRQKKREDDQQKQLATDQERTAKLCAKLRECSLPQGARELAVQVEEILARVTTTEVRLQLLSHKLLLLFYSVQYRLEKAAKAARAISAADGPLQPPPPPQQQAAAAAVNPSCYQELLQAILTTVQKLRLQPASQLLSCNFDVHLGKRVRSSNAATIVVAVLQALGLCDAAAVAAAEMQAAASRSAPAAAAGSAKVKGGAKQVKPSKSKNTTAQVPEAASSSTQAALDTSSLRLKSLDLGPLCLHRFQLQHMGPLLLRDVSSVRDPRIEAFVPDDWQRQVLDVVDDGASALVCAPTSSGKTFISSYVIEKVLSTSHTGIVVIVLPTKALVNQVSAQMFKDFGPEVYGVFTRDYRLEPLNRRVLITVPACLEILMLSANTSEWTARIEYMIFDEVHCINEQGGGATWERLLLLARCPVLALSATVGNPQAFWRWLQSVKELQQQQDQTLSGAAAATLIRPRSYEVQLILHGERYNDLQHSIYIAGAVEPSMPQLHANANGPAAGVTGPNIRELHPCLSFTVKQLAATGYPADLAMTPHEALQLHDALAAVARDAVAAAPTLAGGSGGDDIGLAVAERYSSESVAAAQQMLSRLCDLAPSVFFDAKVHGSLMTRRRMKEWARQLAQLLTNWAQHGPAGCSQVRSVLLLLRGDLDQQLQRTLQQCARFEEHASAYGVDFQLSQLMLLLRQLQHRGMLPVIIFNFSRACCERYAETLCEQLVEEERAAREQFSAELGAAVERYQRQQEAEAERVAKTRDKPAKGKACGVDGDEQGGSSGSSLGPTSSTVQIGGLTFSLDESEPSPSFTLLPINIAQSQDLREAIDDLAEAGCVSPQLLAALRRGIGVHHSGLHKDYRQAVEMLYRRKLLQVVMATGTLAYGIHMPCRTVVMAGDSPFLDALNYRQMSGRAGRRGLDNLGHVVFYCIPEHRIHRLRAAPSPSLHGHFLLTPTLVLRLSLLHTQLQTREEDGDATARRARGSKLASGGAAAAVAAAAAATAEHAMLRMVRCSLLSTTAGPEALAQQMLHAFNMSVHHLQQQRLVNGAGAACGLAGVVTHVFFTEPANFAVVRLLAAGAFHDLLLRYSGAELQEQAMILLAHLFVRRPLHAAAVEYAHRNRAASPSVVVLPQLPSLARRVIADYNAEVFATAKAGVISYAAALKQDESHLQREATMPLSGYRYHRDPAVGMLLAGGDEATAGAANGVQQLAPPSLLASLLALCVHYSACSPFMSLSGHGDDFTSVADMVAAVKQSIMLQPSAIPTLQLQDRHGRDMHQNAYVLDYFKHGQKQALARHNRIPEGDAWELLKTFGGVLSSVSVVLEVAVEEEQEDERSRASVNGGPRPVNNADVAELFSELCADFKDKFSNFNGAPASRTRRPQHK